MAEKEINIDDIARFWDGNAETWAKHVAEGWDVTRDYYQIPAFLEFIGDISGLDILDAGCGEGTNTRTFASLGAGVTGIDISERMIGIAREKEAKEPLGIEYFVGSYADLSRFEYNRFDMVLSTMALMDGPGFETAMAEFFRVLRCGGRMAFSILHPVFSSGDGMGWVKDENGEASGLIVSDYFVRKEGVIRWRFGANPNSEGIELFTVVHFPRTLSQYINGVCAAGFRIDAVDEPRPSEEMIAQFPGFAKLRRHAALLFFLKATKP